MSIEQAAQLVRSKGRGEDTVLIHMTPGEVKGLQAIALAHGGSLTINPETGLPEAGFLKKLLPVIAGAALTGLTGGIINPLTASMIVGGGSTALGMAKGKSFGESLGSGLKAGLGAYGGGTLGASLANTGASAVMEQTNNIVPQSAIKGVDGLKYMGQGVKDLATEGGLGRFGSEFMNQAGGKLGAAAAGAGVLSGLGAFDQPETQFPGLPQQPVYEGPYMPQPREVAFRGQSGVPMSDTSEFMYFRPVSYLPEQIQKLTAADGGEIGMRDGDFVLDARTVSEIGNGSSNAGKEVLASMGGIPVDGRGDGVSDSVRANIGGVQQARVARDEVIIPRDRVQDMGGPGKLYSLMDRAREARRVADRGEDTGLARGLMAV